MAPVNTEAQTLHYTLRLGEDSINTCQTKKTVQLNHATNCMLIIFCDFPLLQYTYNLHTPNEITEPTI